MQLSLHDILPDLPPVSGADGLALGVLKYTTVGFAVGVAGCRCFCPFSTLALETCGADCLDCGRVLHTHKTLINQQAVIRTLRLTGLASWGCLSLS